MSPTGRDWLRDPEHWQGVTRGIEDKLSDALHERLTERFVDRRTSALMRRLRENAVLEPDMSKTGEVVVEGHAIGRLDGFIFVPDASSGGSEAKALQNAAQKALAGEIANRATKLAEVPDKQIVLAADGAIRWNGAAVGKLIAGEEPLRPRVRIIADEHLTGAPREAVEARLDKWVKSHIEKLLGPLVRALPLRPTSVVSPAASHSRSSKRSACSIERRSPRKSKDCRSRIARACASTACALALINIYLPLLLKPAPRALAAQLWALTHDGPESAGLDDLLHLAGSGRTSAPVNRQIDSGLYRVAGYRVCGERAVRVDILERLADLIRPALAWREGVNGTKAAGCDCRRRLHRGQHHDVADRRVGRRFCLGPALARLSRGATAEAAWRLPSRLASAAVAPDAGGRARSRPSAPAEPSAIHAEASPEIAPPVDDDAE